jgi:hypothetical protein
LKSSAASGSIGPRIMSFGQLDKEATSSASVRERATSTGRGVAGPSSRTVGGASHRPLYSDSGVFPSDAAGEYYLDGEMRHTSLTLGSRNDERTFSPQQVYGPVSNFVSSHAVSARRPRIPVGSDGCEKLGHAARYVLTLRRDPRSAC